MARVVSYGDDRTERTGVVEKNNKHQDNEEDDEEKEYRTDLSNNSLLEKKGNKYEKVDAGDDDETETNTQLARNGNGNGRSRPSEMIQKNKIRRKEEDQNDNHHNDHLNKWPDAGQYRLLVDFLLSVMLFSALFSFREWMYWKFVVDNPRPSDDRAWTEWNAKLASFLGWEALVFFLISLFFFAVEIVLLMSPSGLSSPSSRSLLLTPTVPFLADA